MRRTWASIVCIAAGLAAGCQSHEATGRSSRVAPVDARFQRLPAPTYSPMPVLGHMAADSVDFPMPHMRLLSGWGSMQRGVNVWVVSGLATLDQVNSSSIAVGEVCSIAANFEDEGRVRDLMHCYWDKRSLGTYSVLGQTGTVAHLRRSDGRSFTYDLRDGRLRPA